MVDFDEVERIVMAADDLLAFDKISGDGGFGGIHREIGADGHDRDVQCGPEHRDELHIERQRGVSREVERSASAGAFEQKAARISSVASVFVRKARRMDGCDHFGAAKIESPRPADVHRVPAIALFSIELSKLPVRDNDGIGVIFGDRFGVSDVIIVRVRDENVIRSNAGRVDGLGQFVPADEWIEKKAFSAYFDEKTGVAEILDPHFDVDFFAERRAKIENLPIWGSKRIRIKTNIASQRNREAMLKTDFSEAHCSLSRRIVRRRAGCSAWPYIKISSTVGAVEPFDGSNVII